MNEITENNCSIFLNLAHNNGNYLIKNELCNPHKITTNSSASFIDITASSTNQPTYRGIYYSSNCSRRLQTEIETGNKMTTTAVKSTLIKQNKGRRENTKPIIFTHVCWKNI